VETKIKGVKKMKYRLSKKGFPEWYKEFETQGGARFFALRHCMDCYCKVWEWNGQYWELIEEVMPTFKG
jgi:hypothetical protein